MDVGERALSCATVVNAAGARADEVARMAGVRPVGLQPYRRTVFAFAFASHHESASWPLVVGVDESFYFKPEGADQFLASPADEEPVAACDVKPREPVPVLCQVPVPVLQVGSGSCVAGQRTTKPKSERVL